MPIGTQSLGIGSTHCLPAAMASPDIYRYIVRHDAGTAPNPSDGWCTLAICKPRIRKAAQVGDWVIGFRSLNLGGVRSNFGHVLYAMQVAESLSFSEYWHDRRFASRRPSRLNRTPDNFYRPVRDAYGNQRLKWVPNHVHCREALDKDTSGKCVLIARKFWYFGDQSINEDKRLPEQLLCLAPTTQGHVVHKNRFPDDIERFERWIEQFPQGMTGAPTMSLKLPETDISPKFARCS